MQPSLERSVRNGCAPRVDRTEKAILVRDSKCHVAPCDQAIENVVVLTAYCGAVVCERVLAADSAEQINKLYEPAEIVDTALRALPEETARLSRRA